MERLQKILARAGLASRRHAEQLILSGRVRVNGVVVTELGSRADPAEDKVEVDGKRVVAESLVYLILHKPRGVVSTAFDPEGRPTVTSLVESVGARVYPVGRLDFQTSGALVLTNDGDFAAGLLHPKRKVPKDYLVKVEGEMEDKHLDGWRRGIALEDGLTLPADVNVARREPGLTWIEVTLYEGRNQQIRRMGEASGFPVQRLTRLSFAGVGIEGLHAGQWRFLTADELKKLREDYGVPKRIRSANAQGATTPQAPSRREHAKRGGLAPRVGQGFSDRDKGERQGSSEAEGVERPRLPIQRVERKEGRKIRSFEPIAEAKQEALRDFGERAGEQQQGPRGFEPQANDRPRHSPELRANDDSRSEVMARGAERPKRDFGERVGEQQQGSRDFEARANNRPRRSPELRANDDSRSEVMARGAEKPKRDFERRAEDKPHREAKARSEKKPERSASVGGDNKKRHHDHAEDKRERTSKERTTNKAHGKSADRDEKKLKGKKSGLGEKRYKDEGKGEGRARERDKGKKVPSSAKKASSSKTGLEAKGGSKKPVKGKKVSDKLKVSGKRPSIKSSARKPR
jgi:23S rRNA pseudouridine2605 synthase